MTSRQVSGFNQLARLLHQLSFHAQVNLKRPFAQSMSTGHRVDGCRALERH
jgi:hypothetical protein